MPGGFFDGQIDEVRIYDKALSAAQIQADLAVPVTAQLAVLSTTPKSGATDASGAPSITASFNQALSAASVNSTTFELRNAAGNLVPAAVAYDPASGKAS